MPDAVMRGPPSTWWCTALLLLWVTAPSAARAAMAPGAPHRSVLGGALEVEFRGSFPAAGEAAVMEWIGRSARAVAAYFGAFPAERARLVVTTGGGRGVSHGTAHGGRVPEVRIRLGVESSREDLARDWVLVHELVHLAFPSVERRHHWMEEGLATYVEPIARARQGDLPEETVWGDLVEGLPRGQPRAGDRGLDRTPTWGRTYWGGALFWLLADVELRERTGGRVGLEVALRAILRRGGRIGHLWSARQVIAAGDEATNQTVLRELYDRLALRPEAVDLELFWRRLGVRPARGTVELDPRAPLAPIRQAITRAP
jgi:hypothetical protein